MNRDYREKLSHLYDLYSLARIDGHASEQEQRYIKKIADHLGVHDQDLDQVKEDSLSLDFTPPQFEHECIPQFHRLILLLSLHNRWNPSVRAYCRNIALRMGLNLLAVEEIFRMMECRDTKGLTPTKVTEVFKKYYN